MPGVKNMAEMVTKLELENAKVDVKDLGEAVNENKVITPRDGDPFKSGPMAIQEIEQNGAAAVATLNAKADEVVAQGFYKGFPTETALKASLPAVSEMRARADDTRKIWRWIRTSAEGVTPVTGTWFDTGLSDKDLAAVDATTKANAAEANSKVYAEQRVLELINSPPIDIFTTINKITGSYISKTGVQTASANWSCSGFLQVKYRDVVIYNASATNVVAFIAAYDANKTFLRELVSTSNSAVTVLNNQKEIEADVKFIRVSFYTASATAYSFLLKPFEIETELLNKTETSAMVFDELTAKPNLFDSTKARNGYSLVNNVETGNTNWLYSDYMPVVPNGTYTANKSGYKDPASQTGIHYYDAAKALVSYSGAQTANVAFSVPANAYFMRLNFVKTLNPEIAIIDIVVNQGITAQKDGKFELKVKEVLSESNITHRYSGFVYIPLGDSISDSNTTPTTYPPIVAAHFGMTLIDLAISGSRTRRSFEKSSATDETLATGNIVTIAHGTNDFTLSTPLGSITDTPTPKATLDNAAYRSDSDTTGSFYADYKGVIEHLYSVNPKVRIRLATPIQRTQSPRNSSTDINTIGLKLIDYVNAIKEIADYYSIPVLDNYNKSGFNKLTMPTLLFDGLHPWAFAQKDFLANAFIGLIESN